MKNIISLCSYRKKKKSWKWLLSLSEFDLICEFIEAHDSYEKSKRSKDSEAWLDQVSEALTIRCFKNHLSEQI